MALFSRKHIKHVELPYGLTEKDLIGDIEGFPMGVVVRMMEEQFTQKGRTNISSFQIDRMAGFTWSRTEAGLQFWIDVINKKDFDLFFKRYPEYERYNLS